MSLPKNKFTPLATLWFAASIYALLFHHSSGGAMPFPHFDKLVHFLLFFAQIWLCTRAYRAAGKNIPIVGLLSAALIWAVASELAQALFTLDREGTWGDALADICGAAAALYLAKQVERVEQARLD
ncbi:VanZ family protein [Neisseria lisongii]|uniref:VanZ family protein n=1 Tax=Neisseria lisongii TaxID=2912188 RepID=A0AAW5ACW5_9NEIS|nr:VanZ family protein [Neisseria lisongii]MCF7528658.1 VanZ family protein [Neisseria lisongii]MCF7529516.1 VanZ family protein [Neisseria lisongii]